ncbi:DUF1120 domain-containing protein [Klebsiella michiganensis]|uniref:hypothetical protein n=1 Tax=Klebsiella michiganensis TaxID=1134687 RepID=UPI000AFF3738|nr:hypothetical protein [Klebsiella michiganensis]
MGEISVKTGNNARNGGKNSLNRLIRCVCGKKIGPDPRNFNQRVSLGRNDLLIRTFPNANLVVENATFNGISLQSIDQTYGVGKAGEVNIGSYSLFIKNNSVTADGNNVDNIIVDYYDLGGTWRNNTNGTTVGSSYRDITVANTGSVEPLAFKTATFPMATSLAIQNTSTLAITDDTPLDGQLTISLRYL